MLRLRKSIIVNADRAAVRDPRVTRLQVINSTQNLFHQTDAAGTCVAPLPHNNHPFLCSSSIVCRSPADSAGHRHRSRVCHDPKDRVPISSRASFGWSVTKNAFLRNILCVKTQLLPSNVWLHLPAVPTLPRERAGSTSSTSHARPSYLPSFGTSAVRVCGSSRLVHGRK